jgi:hypothetical protein
MGTRADFYIGRGEQAEWLGSIAWDGYPDGIPIDIVRPQNSGYHSEQDYRDSVKIFLNETDHATKPEQGWPWPWATSHTTDYAYAWEDGIVWACCFGHRWYHANDPALNDDETEAKEAVFPDMSDRMNAVMSGKRSGLIVVSSRGVE